jgi:filamentous hemagglutinin
MKMFKKFIVWLVIYCMTFSPALASAQIQADQGAPKNQQPQVVSTGGGVPQVNINTPNSSGLSYNKYQQFDVDNRGAILNNSNKNTQTQLGGWIEGNPNLAGRQANIILNEVNSANPSRLNGHVEVAGQRAEVIIANHSGIQVNGGGFINTSRATLTTGRPQMNGDQLTGFRVEKGHIEINGQGLNGQDTDYTAIISQSASVNAGIWANDLKVVTGRNTVSRDASQATALEPNADEIQGVALDVSALGGMYAGQIKLIGTDKGLGVRNAGNLVAQVGEVVITTDGRLENSGTIHGQKAARVEAKGRVDNTNRIQSAGAVSVKTAQNIDNQGQIVANQAVELKSAQETTNSGLIQAGESLSLEAAKLDNTGEILSGGRASIKTDTLVNNKSAIEAASDLEIAAASLDNSGKILAGGRGVINVTTRLLNSSLVQALEELNITAALFDNLGDIFSGGRNIINAVTKLDNSGSIQAVAELMLAAQNLANRGGILSGGTSEITAAALDNKGSLEADELHIIAENFQNSGNVLANNSLTEVGTLRNTGLFDGGEVVIKADLLENINTGVIMGDHLALQGKDIVNGLPLGQDGEIGKNGVTSSGLIGARGRLDIGAENLPTREDGIIYSAGNLYIGGLLDEAYQAVGRAANVLNSSALITWPEIFTPPWWISPI